MSKQKFSALIVDDDEWSVRLMRGMLHECFPGLIIDATSDPEVREGYNVYFIDNEINGNRCAPELASRVRESEPSSLVIAFSGTLDSETMRGLLNSGCSGVCDKSRPDDLPRTMEVTQRYLQELSESTSDGRVNERGMLSALNSISGLLREWNTKLRDEDEKQERA